MKKQIGYADAMHIPFVGIIGETELADSTVTVKNLASGDQQQLSFDELLALLA